MSTQETVHWHGLQLAEVVRLLDTNLSNGLSEEEARQRLAKFGPNQIARRPGKPAWLRFLLQFHQPLIHSARSPGLFSNRWLLAGIATMIAAQLAFTYAPAMNVAFHTGPLDAGAWLRILAVAAAASTIVAFEKWLRARREPQQMTAVSWQSLVHRS